jgi:hypothetical protein
MTNLQWLFRKVTVFLQFLTIFFAEVTVYFFLFSLTTLKGEWTLKATARTTKAVRELVISRSSSLGWRTQPTEQDRIHLRSNCWLHALRLNFEHPMSKQGDTHICAVLRCGHLYNLTKLPQKEYRSNINSLYNLKKSARR